MIFEIVLSGKTKKSLSMWMKLFEELDLKALPMIQLCLFNSVLRVVVKEETPTCLWLKLESIYMTNRWQKHRWQKRLLLRSKFHALHLENCSSLKCHIDEFNSIMMDLNNFDVILMMRTFL